MQTLRVPPERLKTFLLKLATEVGGTPVYRSLGGRSLDEYSQDGVMTPKDGAYSVGKGVFFYMDPDSVVAENGKVILVGTVESLSEGRKLVDTRKGGYRHETDAVPEKDGWELWYEVLQDDTITLISGRNGGIPVYTRRTPVRREEIMFEVFVE